MFSSRRYLPFGKVFAEAAARASSTAAFQRRIASGLRRIEQPLDSVEVRPEVVPLDAIDAEIDREPHDVRELVDVRLEERELERDAAALGGVRPARARRAPR